MPQPSIELCRDDTQCNGAPVKMCVDSVRCNGFKTTLALPCLLFPAKKNSRSANKLWVPLTYIYIKRDIYIYIYILSRVQWFLETNKGPFGGGGPILPVSFCNQKNFSFTISSFFFKCSILKVNFYHGTYYSLLGEKQKQLKGDKDLRDLISLVDHNNGKTMCEMRVASSFQYPSPT